MALAFLLLLLPGQAEAATRYVGVCGAPNHPSVTAAITAASAGDSILICPGTYNEAVTVNKDNLTIRGSSGNRADVTVSNSGIPFTLSGAGATLMDMTISSSNNAGINRGWAASGSAYVFDNLAVSAKERGIYIETSTKVTMKNLSVSSSHNDAIHLAGSTNGAHEFESLTLNAKNYGLYTNKGGALFKDITVSSSNNYAMYLNPGYDASFSNINATANNGGGLYLGWVSSGKALRFSNINVSAKDKGIYIEVAGKITMSDLAVSSSNNDAVYIGWAANAAHEFERLNLSANNGNALYVNRGGALFRDLTLTAKEFAFFGAPSSPASFSNITATSSNNVGLNLGWNAVSAVLSFSNVDVTAKNRGIYIEVSGKATFNDVNVTSSNSDAIYMSSSVSGAHEFDTLTLNAKEYGLYVYRGGTRFANLDITSSDRDALFMYSDYDATLDGLILNAPNGNGINLGWANYNRDFTISNSNISAKEQGIRIEKSDVVTLNKLIVSSSNSDAIFLGSGASGAHALSNLTLEAKESGVRMDSQLYSAGIDNLCVNDSKYGVWVSNWNTRAVTITDSKLTASDYGIRTDADSASGRKTTASGNCILKSSAPRAYSNSTTHSFTGNFWQGVAGGVSYSDGNVRDAATLGSCPVTSCYNGATPATLSAHYTFDDTWGGSDGLDDSSGMTRHATLAGTVAQEAAPASGGKPETCKAGRFRMTGYFSTASGLDVHTASGEKNSVSFWMYWDGGFHSSNFTMPFSWGGVYYDLAVSKYRAEMGAGVIGFNTGNGDVYGVTADGLANGWHHVAAVFNNGDVSLSKLYIDGVKRTLVSYGGQNSRSATASAGIGAGLGWGGDYKWSGLLDNVKIYKGEMTTAQIAADMAESSTCAISSAPVAEWRMDEVTWSGVAGEVRDSAGAAHATASGASTHVNGKLCRAGDLSATGTADYLRLPEAVLQGRTDFSLALWYKSSVNKGQQELLQALGSGADDDEIELYLVNKRKIRLKLLDSEEEFSIGFDLDDGQWHHLALTRAGASGCLYVDGALNACKTYPTGALSIAANSLLVGQEQDAVGGSFANNQSLEALVDEYKAFSGALTAGQIAAGYANELAGSNWDGTARVCAAAPSGPAALNAVDAGGNPVSGSITTKSAGTGFNLDIRALNAGRSAADAAAAGDVLVDLLANTAAGAVLGADNCPASGTSLSVGTATLSAGSAGVNVPAVADAWRDVRVRMRYPAAGPYTVTACSVDNFAIKPATLTAIASDADWAAAGTTRTLANTGVTGGAVHKAGQPFTLRVTGYNAAGVITSQYDGAPAASVSCVLPAGGCVAGSLSPGSFSASAGTLTSNSASFSEAGAIAVSFTDTTFAAVDSDDSAASCAGFHVCSSAINVGRFVPDHYDVVSIQSPVFQTFGAACASRAFTYIGQEFGFATLPRARVTAKNAAGGTTVNAKGTLWKLSPNGHFGASWRCQKSGGASCGSVSLTSAGFSAENLVANSDGTGDFTWPANLLAPSGVKYSFTRSNPAVAPFNAEIGLGLTIRDSSEAGNCGLVSCLILDSQPANPPTWGSNIAFDAGNAFRQGRLRLSNASGSELLSLPVSLTAQYWNGQGWAANTADNCTGLAAPTLTFFAQSADNHLASGETTASFNATLVAGAGNLRLSAPGTGNFGYLDLTVTAPAWLRHNWDGADQGSDGDLLDDHPRARASFGKRGGASKVILRRELY